MRAAAIRTEIPLATANLLDQMSVGIALLDGDLHLLHANSAFVDLTGVRRWRGCPLASLGPAAAELCALVERARTAGTSLMLRACELAVRDPPLRADVAVSAWSQQGTLLELHALSAHECAPIEPRISHSLRGLAHEVKNPLAGLRGAAQLLERRSSDPQQKHLATLIISEADRLVALADRLLHSGGKPHLSQVNLHEIVERARTLIAHEADPALRLERDYDPSLPPMRGDADRLLQLLLNLLRNALQAQAHTIVLRTRAEHAVLIEGQPQRLALRVEVIDDGVGVADAVRDNLFMPLVSARSDGSGLGLALAQEIAHEHGGKIGFSSRAGHTVFRVILPLETGHA
jgi:two-component system nitrogen regulation sensor histidine kinase GlnL